MTENNKKKTYSGIFLDTGKVEEVKKYHKMGLIRGVTTNPTILLKSGITGGIEGVKTACQEIAKIIEPYPLSIELTINDNPEQMIEQAKEFYKWASNVNIKVPIHGPNGELDNLYVIHELESKHNIMVNVTAMMSAQQCFLAAQAGASYVSLFAGRINDMGHSGVDEIKRARQLLDAHNLESKIICASTREVSNVHEWINAGGHIVTVTPEILNKMIVHPYSKETVQMFLNDAKKL
jgi:transaldolase